jgi:CRISPR-associated endonuclease/helicase Cas3
VFLKTPDAEFIARYRASDGLPQCILEHLQGSAELAKVFAGKVDMPMFGEVLGLLHDLGKYSEAFQNYIKSSSGELEPSDEEYIDARTVRGKIDHSSAGAHYVWRESGISDIQRLAASILALCIASHHSGLIDVIAPDGTDVFSKRMCKSDDKVHYNDSVSFLDDEIEFRAKALLASPVLEDELKSACAKMRQFVGSTVTAQFTLGFLTRFLFSALIDADRLNSAERMPLNKTEWRPLISLLEQHMTSFTVRNGIDETRAEISKACQNFAERPTGLYQLTVPTGGGKTLASLRFALHHASRHNLDRIIYVVPFTSIIDQNARVARSVFAPLESDGRTVVLEHHSNLTPEQDTSESKLLAENWDAPIVYTTAVQFLETLFAGGTRGVRRLHQLANAVIIFDEIQTIPIRTVHLFNNAINFLVSQCGSTAVFCTATQPLLDRVDARKGAAKLSENPEIMGSSVDELFTVLHRARIKDGCKDGGWTVNEIAGEALSELAVSGSLLIIVNKKAQARELFQTLRERTDSPVYHLSTNMCPAHRMTVLDNIRPLLDQNKSVICVSTQLIEAGVDVDFGSVIRYLAGLDSIAQAAGRCNRNGRRETGRVLIVNPANENLDKLPEMKVAQEITRRVLREFKDDPKAFDGNLQSPKVMERYYFYYFFNRAHEMAFPVTSRDIKGMAGTSDLLTLLSTNNDAVEIYKNNQRKAPSTLLRQAFMSAADAFRVIDSPTEGVIATYGGGERLVTQLMTCSREDRVKLLKEVQRHSVNLFPYEMQKLRDGHRVHEVWEGSGIYYLDERHYSEEFGVSTEEVTDFAVRII